MATGIISNTLLVEGHRELSDLMSVVNVLAYPWLAILTVSRAIRYPRALWLDMISPRLVFRSSRLSLPATFSVLACTCVDLQQRRYACGYLLSSFGFSSFISASGY
jgi:hypothetical protein